MQIVVKLYSSCGVFEGMHFLGLRKAWDAVVTMLHVTVSVELEEQSWPVSKILKFCFLPPTFSVLL